MPIMLMCPPDHYRIAYEINPWMDRRRQVDHALAREQWQALYDLLNGPLGVKVELIEPVADLPDMVFTANAGLIRGELFIRSNFRFPVRQGEAGHFEAWFRKRGYEVLTLPPGHFFEGEGDLLPCGDELFAGYHFRSDISSHHLIAAALSTRIFSLELVDRRFYHLDTCFCPLPDGNAVYWGEAFDPYAQQVLKSYIPEGIPLDLEDALRFACNAILVGRQVVLNRGCLALEQQLQARGYQVFPLDLSEFIKAGGSAKCLVLTLA